MDLLHAYSQNQAIWTDDFNIPESGNGVPDLLDEVKWGLDWLVRMQEANGSVLSIQGLASASLPSAATGASLYGKASTSATLAAAAAYAYGAKVYGSYGTAAFNTYAADLTDRAKKAWDWALANPTSPSSTTTKPRAPPAWRRQQETDDKGRASAPGGCHLPV